MQATSAAAAAAVAAAVVAAAAAAAVEVGTGQAAAAARAEVEVWTAATVGLIRGGAARCPPMGVEKPGAPWSAAAALGMDLEGVPF